MRTTTARPGQLDAGRIKTPGQRTAAPLPARAPPGHLGAAHGPL
ncbi:MULTISPECIES: hypothetical protein [Actinoalloteichus]|nr:MULTISPECIES: hypothetical protein [Actinoalloteichus]